MLFFSSRVWKQCFIRFAHNLNFAHKSQCWIENIANKKRLLQEIVCHKIVNFRKLKFYRKFTPAFLLLSTTFRHWMGAKRFSEQYFCINRDKLHKKSFMFKQLNQQFMHWQTLSILIVSIYIGMVLWMFTKMFHEWGPQWHQRNSVIGRENVNVPKVKKCLYKQM